MSQRHCLSLVHNVRTTQIRLLIPSLVSQQLPNIMLLFFVFLGFLLKHHNGYALPLRSTPNMTSSPEEGTILTLIVSASTKSERPRTLFSVAWSCILTVFICAWTSVHPNVPPQSRIGGLLTRVKLMFWTIVAPELVLAWAVRQWFGAREIRDIYNQHRGEYRV